MDKSYCNKIWVTLVVNLLLLIYIDTHFLILQESPVNYGENYGLIQRSFMYLFDLVQERKKTITYTLSASYLEIYNEQVSA